MKHHDRSKIQRFTFKVIVIVAFVATLAACKKSSTEDPFPADMRQTVSTDAESESVTNEADDLVISALTMADTPSGRYASFADDRLACATLTFDSTANRVSGSVVVDFGTGCVDARGNTRVGKIQITWINGRWFKVGSHTTTSFQNYSMNGILLGNGNGATLHNVSSVSSPLTWTVESFYNITWPDQTGGTRTIHQTRQWVIAANPADDKFIVAQSKSSTTDASGITRYGKSFTTVITTPLEYQRSCVLSNKVLRPVKGIRTITYDNTKTVTMDFGNGTCNDTFTITTAATTQTVTFKNGGLDID